MTNSKEQQSSVSIEKVGKPEKVNFANQYLEKNVRPLLGDEITDYWLKQTETWQQRFVTKSLAELASAVGTIPETKVTTTQEADAIVNYKLEHWMIGGNVNVAGNLAIALAATKSRHTHNKKTTKTMLDIVGGAQARMSWERKHELKLKKIEEEATELQEKLLETENLHYNSSMEKLAYLQKNQQNFVKRRLKQSAENPQEFKAYMERRALKALDKFNQYAPYTQIVLGRDDGKNFVIRYEKGPWTQGSLVEEDKLRFSEPKGVSVTFYRYNETTGEKEFFVCYGKRDAFTRTHQLTPAWQTSITRAKAGNHPDQEYNPMLSSLKDAFAKAGSANGVEISYIDANPNRNNESPIAVATIDWASYSPEDQAQILKVMVQENNNKPLLHSWVSESKIAILRRHGMVDKDGNIGPAVNGFFGISLGSRSPAEIQEDANNRLTFKQIRQLGLDYSNVTPASLERATQKMIESGDEAEALFLRGLILVIANQGKQYDRIHENFPHAMHELKAKNDE